MHAFAVVTEVFGQVLANETVGVDVAVVVQVVVAAEYSSDGDS